jgi:glycosyltransferase involved in cell wall biosynthesis
MNGGLGILSSYFGGTNIIYAKKCQELKPEVNSFWRWYHKLSDCRVLHVDNYDDLYHTVDDIYVKRLPVVNILLRTSNRPKGFAKAIESIREQTYKNVNIIVSYDDEATNKYITPYPVRPLRVYPVAIDDIPRQPNFVEYGLKAPYNLYLNALAREVKEGWVTYFDDDTWFVDKNCLEKIVKSIKTQNSLVLWKIENHERVVPLPRNFGQPPVNCDIGGNSFMFHSKFLPLVHWDAYRKGNYRVAKKLYSRLEPVWINELLSTAYKIVGNGNRKDIEL